MNWNINEFVLTIVTVTYRNIIILYFGYKIDMKGKKMRGDICSYRHEVGREEEGGGGSDVALTVNYLDCWASFSAAAFAISSAVGIPSLTILPKVSFWSAMSSLVFSCSSCNNLSPCSFK